VKKRLVHQEIHSELFQDKHRGMKV